MLRARKRPATTAPSYGDAKPLTSPYTPEYPPPPLPYSAPASISTPRVGHKLIVPGVEHQRHPPGKVVVTRIGPRAIARLLRNAGWNREEIVEEMGVPRQRSI